MLGLQFSSNTWNYLSFLPSLHPWPPSSGGALGWWCHEVGTGAEETPF